MAVDLKILTKLREATGAGVNDCQASLAESGGDFDKAIEILRKKGAIKAAKKLNERSANEGLIHSYIHANGKIGVLIEVRCETDFVAKSDDFKTLVHDVAMQIAAASPSYLRPEDVPETEKNQEKEIYQERLKNEGKPKNMWAKIIEGKLEKYYQEVCLLKQTFVKDDSLTIEDLITEAISKLGEKIEIIQFTRYQI